VNKLHHRALASLKSGVSHQAMRSPPQPQSPMTATTKPSRSSPRALLRHLHPTNLKVAAQLATQATQDVANLVQGVYRSLHRPLRLSMSAEPKKTSGLTGQIDRGIGGVEVWRCWWGRALTRCWPC